MLFIYLDFGIPDSTQEMINLINELDIRKKSLDDPVVVHCRYS
jgi:hypothetical protein